MTATNGRRQTGSARVSQRDIARQTGVSQMTVSRVLRGESCTSASTRRVVIEAAEKLGYRPNRIAQSLLEGKTGIVGYLSAALIGQYFTQILEGIQDTLSETDHHLLLAPRSKHADVDDEEIGVFLQYNVDGMIVMPKHSVPYEESLYPRLVEEGQNLVFLGSHYGFPDVPRVHCDIRGGARDATAYLINRGHRRIAYLGSRQEKRHSRTDREAGYQEALCRRLSGSAPLIAYNPSADEDDIQRTVLELLRRAPNLTALLCYNDETALAAQVALESMGRRVPEDVSLIGFGNDLLHPDMMRVPLTTVDQSSREMGVRAAELMLALLDGEETERVRIVRPRLVERDSVRDLR